MTEDGIAWRWLAAADLADVWTLHRIAIAKSPAPGLVKPESAGFFERMVGQDGAIIGGFAGPRLVVYGVLQWRLAAEDDPRAGFGLAGGTGLAKLAGTSVDPDWRGRGLHDTTIALRLQRAREIGCPHLYATAAPGNWRSWTNLLVGGFTVRALTRRYGTLWRFLLHRRPAPVQPAGPSALYDPDDHATLGARLSQGAQGVGWQVDADGKVWLRVAETVA